MAEQHIITRQCSCGKIGDQIDDCILCKEYREKQLPQTDSMILSALKLALVEGFFQQQHFYSPNGGSSYYGGQATQMVQKLMESKEFKDMLMELQNLILSKKEEWEQLALRISRPYVEQRARQIADSWDFKDGLQSLLHKAATEQAKAIFENDPVLKEKIAKAVSSQKYTVEFDIRVKITEERAPQ